MNVLYVSNCFSFSPSHAAAVTTYEIVKRLARKGYEVTVLVPNIEYSGSVTVESAVFDNVNVKASISASFSIAEKGSIANGLSCSVLYVPLILKALRKKPCYDVIISMYHPTHLATFSAYTIAQSLHVPLIAKVYDLLPDALDPHTLRRMYKDGMFRLNSWFLKRSDTVLVPSSEWMKLAAEVYGVSHEKLVLFPNGVDASRFNPNVENNRLRRKLGLENARVVLYSGRLSAIRGLDYLIEAMSKVAKEEPDASLVIVGSGPEKSKLVALSKHLGVDRSVIFVNEVSNDSMPSYLSLADVAIGPLIKLPITVGTFPIKVLEYMACAKPIIACHGGLSKDLIANGHDGLLVNSRNLHELSSAIVMLLEDDQLAGRIGVNARKRVESLYDWDVVTERLYELLNSVCQR